MKLLDLLFKTEKPQSDVLEDDLITKPKKSVSTIQKPIENEKFSSINYNHINVYAPKNQEEVEKIVLNLQKNEASIINLKGIEKTTYIKILDFLNGATFALKGTINRLTQDLYLISPENLKIKVLK